LSRRWEDNIKIKLKEMGCEVLGYIHSGYGGLLVSKKKREFLDYVNDYQLFRKGLFSMALVNGIQVKLHYHCT
jgi:hypothetical protein